MTMSGHLIVMRVGRVEQVGAPLEVFSRPATPYVASFLGGMNLMTGTAQGDRLSWEGGNARVAGLGRATTDALTVGVRPEHLEMVAGPDAPPASAGFTAEGDVLSTELLGTDRVVHLRTGTQTVRVRIDAAQTITDRVTLWAAPEHVHIHATETGKRHD